jgi:hypothetical protein
MVKSFNSPYDGNLNNPSAKVPTPVPVPLSQMQDLILSLKTEIQKLRDTRYSLISSVSLLTLIPSEKMEPNADVTKTAEPRSQVEELVRLVCDLSVENAQYNKLLNHIQEVIG